MKEFIGGTLHKWRFYKYKDKYVLDAYKDNTYYYEIIPEVFGEIKLYEEDEITLVEYDSDIYKELMNKFFCPLRRMDKLEFLITSLKIINKYPLLRIGTLMGWVPYEDKTKDPNYYDMACIFPDGNKYTITLHKGNLCIFPGFGSAFSLISLCLPLFKCEINLNQWADKIYKNKDIYIEYIKVE